MGWEFIFFAEFHLFTFLYQQCFGSSTTKLGLRAIGRKIKRTSITSLLHLPLDVVYGNIFRNGGQPHCYMLVGRGQSGKVGQLRGSHIWRTRWEGTINTCAHPFLQYWPCEAHAKMDVTRIWVLNYSYMRKVSDELGEGEDFQSRMIETMGRYRSRLSNP